MCEIKNEVRPGIHPSCNYSFFPEKEKEIIRCFSKEWFVTYTSNTIEIGTNSQYRFFLAKPVPSISNLINIKREVLVLLCDYESFEPRTLSAITQTQNSFDKLRVEKLCSIIVSNDKNIQNDLKELLKNDQEAQIVVPFYYGEFPDNAKDSYFFRNRLKTYFFSRDLFAAESPLKSDLFFFSRRHLIHELVSRHKANQVSGMFGLRKSGKTSLMYGVKRALFRDNIPCVIIDCQNTAFNQKRWNLALRYILSQIIEQTDIEARLKQESYFTEEKAAEVFESELRKLLKEQRATSILVIFDELENISPGVSPSHHWGKGDDFIFFWQTLRAIFQKTDSPLTYLLCGTNPVGVEQQTIKGFDNPIYAQVPSDYIPRFEVNETREMIRTLGRIMGLSFEEHLYGIINEDFGGHPYLIRHVCSLIHKLASKERPVEVTTKTYEKAKKQFQLQNGHFFEMVLGVLKSYFSEEYDLLRLLACEEEEEFEETSNENPMLLSHLIGYQIISKGSDGCYFRISSLKDYISGKERYKKKFLNEEEKRNEISERRNRIEIKLRRLIKNSLTMIYGKSETRSKVEKIIGCKNIEYKNLFNPKVNKIYFSSLIKIIRKEWDLFENHFGSNKAKYIRYLETINELRDDAHAKATTDDEFNVFRISAKSIEDVLEDYD